MSNTVTRYRLSVCLESEDYNLAVLIDQFILSNYTLTQTGFGVNPNDAVKKYVSKVKNQSIWYFHTTQFVHLYQWLKEINRPLTIDSYIDKKDYKVATTDFKIRDNWKLRDNQIPVYDFLVKEPTGTKLIPLVTGSGKTSITLIALGTLKKRMALVIPTFLMEKWAADIVGIHEATVKDVLLVSGRDSMGGLIEMARTSTLTYDYLIISNRTMQDFITSYEEDPHFCEEVYGCVPIDFFPLLGVGVVVNDETHISFHALYKILLHTNVEYHIGLSATLMSEDTVTSRVHRIVYGQEQTYHDNMLKPYTDLYPISYTIDERKNKFIKTTNYGSKHYSHIAYEKSILKQSFLLSGYFKLIDSVVDDYYMDEYMKDDKLMIFVATIDMATRLTKHLSERLEGLVVARYCEDDNYEDMIKADVIVTTVLSAGVGLDVPGLRVCIQTVCISSQPSNIQTFGRLRELKDRDTKFCYLYCHHIPKHRSYHQKRVELFTGRALSIVHRRARVNV